MILKEVFFQDVKSFADRNRQMIFFILRVVIIYFSWKLLSWFLGEERTPNEDRIWPWLSAGWEQMNDWIRVCLLYFSKLIFDFLGYSSNIISNYRLSVQDLAYVEVGNYCLGIQLCIFFVGLICSYPGKWENKLCYSIFGVISITILNILRIVIIVFAVHAYPKQIQFNHDYVFNVIIYVFTFFIWLKFVKSQKNSNKDKPIPIDFSDID